MILYYIIWCDIWWYDNRSPSKRYARRTVGPCTSRDIMWDSRRSTPMLDSYAGSSANKSSDAYSEQSASDGRYSVSSSAYSPVSRQPVNNSWTSYHTNSTRISTGLSTTSPPNSADSIAKSANPALRSTLPADYKPSGYGSASRTNVKSNSTGSNSIGGENRPRTTRSSAPTVESGRVTGGESGHVSSRVSSPGDQSYGSLPRRRPRTYDGNTRANGNGRRSRHYEPRAPSDQSSDWQVNLWTVFIINIFCIIWSFIALALIIFSK